MAVAKVIVRAALGYDVDRASSEAATVPEGKSLTLQSQAAETDINNIVKAYGVTGQLPTTLRVPLQADFDDILTYQDAMNAVRSAQLAFDALPAGLRRKLDNDPGAFVAYCEDPDNLAELRKLGLAPEMVEVLAPLPAPAPVEPVPVPT